MKTRLYRAFFESKQWCNGYTTVTAKNAKEALAKAREIGLIKNDVKQDEVKFIEVNFLRWIDAQNHFIWKSDTSKMMNNGKDSV